MNTSLGLATEDPSQSFSSKNCLIICLLRRLSALLLGHREANKGQKYHHSNIEQCEKKKIDKLTYCTKVLDA